MNNQTRTTFNSLKSRMLASAVVLVAASSLLAPIAAHADTKSGSGSGSGGGCQVEVVDDHGNTIGYQTVEVGTQVGLFHCGADGQWHFGWFVNAEQAGPTKPVIHVAPGQFAAPIASAPHAQQ